MSRGSSSPYRWLVWSFSLTFCYIINCVLYSWAITSLRKREMIAFLKFSSSCLVLCHNVCLQRWQSWSDDDMVWSLICECGISWSYSFAFCNFLNGLNASNQVKTQFLYHNNSNPKKGNEYDQEIPQSHNVDLHIAPWGRTTEHWLSQDDIRKTVKVNQLAYSSPSRWLQNYDTKY